MINSLLFRFRTWLADHYSFFQYPKQRGKLVNREQYSDGIFAYKMPLYRRVTFAIFGTAITIVGIVLLFIGAILAYVITKVITQS